MRFIPINLDNVKNAATMFVGIANSEPWNGKWTYSSAYARLFAIAKSIGFTGFITMDNNGLPCGFVMGNTKNRDDGGLDFVLCEQLAMRHIVRMIYVEQGGNGVSRYFATLNFSKMEDVVAVEKRIN